MSPAVRRAAGQHGGREAVWVERQGDLMRGPERSERHPRGRRPLIAGFGGPGTDAPRNRRRIAPRRAAIRAERSVVAARPAVRPAILLPDANDVSTVHGIHVHPGLDLGVLEDLTGRRATRLAG